MLVPRYWLPVGRYPRGIIVHQQRYTHSDNDKTVDI